MLNTDTDFRMAGEYIDGSSVISVLDGKEYHVIGDDVEYRQFVDHTGYGKYFLKGEVLTIDEYKERVKEMENLKTGDITNIVMKDLDAELRSQLAEELAFEARDIIVEELKKFGLEVSDLANQEVGKLKESESEYAQDMHRAKIDAYTTIKVRFYQFLTKLANGEDI